MRGLFVALITGGCVFAAPPHVGPPAENFDGERFHNQVPIEHRGLRDLFRWQATRQVGPWPGYADQTPGPAPPERVGPGELRVTWVGHATMLVQIDGLNVLTDPLWSDRASPVSWVGPKRYRAPGIRFEDLPPIDAVLVSHNHYDHLDVPTLRRLHEAHAPRVLVGLGNADLLAAHGIPGAVDLDWWASVELAPGVRAHFVPAQHFSGRSVADRDVSLWGGFVIEGPGGPVYFAGDTGFGPHFAQIGERFGPIRLAMLPIGAFRPEWFMARVHISPEEAVRAHAVLAARTSVAMHHGTFKLADDGQDEPVGRLDMALTDAGVPRSTFWVLGFGEGRDAPPRGDPDPS